MTKRHDYRMTIFFVLIVLIIVSVILGMDLRVTVSDLINRIAINLILALSIIPGIQCGIQLNFAMSLGIECGLLATLIAIENNFTYLPAFVVSVFLAIFASSIVGYFYGRLLNKAKGLEMTISTYTGYSAVSFMCLAWCILPFHHPSLGWAIGSGIRNTVSLDGIMDRVLDRVLLLKFQQLLLPIGFILFLSAILYVYSLFTKSKLGIAMNASGKNPKFVHANGINVHHMRIVGTMLSMILASIGIIIYAQSFGFLQLYQAPLGMPFISIASVLLGGATVNEAKIRHAVIGVILFQGLMSLGLPIANHLIPSGSLSEILRLILQNGIILFALSKIRKDEANV